MARRDATIFTEWCNGNEGVSCVCLLGKRVLVFSSFSDARFIPSLPGLAGYPNCHYLKPSYFYHLSIVLRSHISKNGLSDISLPILIHTETETKSCSEPLRVTVQTEGLRPSHLPSALPTSQLVSLSALGPHLLSSHLISSHLISSPHSSQNPLHVHFLSITRPSHLPSILYLRTLVPILLAPSHWTKNDKP